MLCSRECRNARQGARRRKSPEKVCRHCGATFRPANVQRQYCSPECTADAKAARKELRRRTTYHQRPLSDEERLERAARYTPKPDPTPEQILERCLEIQATWTPAEEYDRRVYKPSYGFPVYG